MENGFSGKGFLQSVNIKIPNPMFEFLFIS